MNKKLLSILLMLLTLTAFSQEKVDYQPTTAGGYFLMNFLSKVNGGDKAFLLFQDESSANTGSGIEDVRFTIGVFNDFRQSAVHSDELWFQGGGRTVFNVGLWDSEYNSIIGTPNAGVSGGFEWRVNNNRKLLLDHYGYMTLAKNGNISKIIFSPQSNDPGEIRHVESNNSSQLWLDPSDDFDVGDPNDFFIIGEPDTNTKRFWVRADGHTYVNKSLNIGTEVANPDYVLVVNGRAKMEEVKVVVDATTVPDYVFTNDYKLMSLNDLKVFIDKNQHLPEVSSAAVMAEEGMNLKEMNLLLLQKIEELTLHLIKKDEEITEIKKQLELIQESLKAR